jgi:hypothetical protein
LSCHSPLQSQGATACETQPCTWQTARSEIRVIASVPGRSSLGHRSVLQPIADIAPTSERPKSARSRREQVRQKTITRSPRPARQARFSKSRRSNLPQIVLVEGMQFREDTMPRTTVRAIPCTFISAAIFLFICPSTEAAHRHHHGRDYGHRHGGPNCASFFSANLRCNAGWCTMPHCKLKQNPPVPGFVTDRSFPSYSFRGGP